MSEPIEPNPGCTSVPHSSLVWKPARHHFGLSGFSMPSYFTLALQRWAEKEPFQWILLFYPPSSEGEVCVEEVEDDAFSSTECDCLSFTIPFVNFLLSEVCCLLLLMLPILPFCCVCKLSLSLSMISAI